MLFKVLRGETYMRTIFNNEMWFMAQTQINMLTGSSIKGRLLAQTAVTLDTATVTEP